MGIELTPTTDGIVDDVEVAVNPHMLLLLPLLLTIADAMLGAGMALLDEMLLLLILLELLFVLLTMLTVEPTAPTLLLLPPGVFPPGEPQSLEFCRSRLNEEARERDCDDS